MTLKIGEDENSNETKVFTLSEQCKDGIKRPEAQLESEQRLQRSLEDNLLEIRKDRTTIYNVPEELLLQIFTEVQYVSRKGSTNPGPRMAIGPIFLTCKRWYQIVTCACNLWKDISLTVLADPTAIARDIGYVNASFRYSEPAPMNITLELPSEQQFRSFVDQKESGKQMSPSIVSQRDDHAHLTDASTNDTGKLRDSQLYGEVNDAICNLMRATAGERGANLLRIRSIAISFDSLEFSNWIKLDLFHHPTPILEEINIVDVERANLLRPIFIYPCPNLFRLSSNSPNAVEQLAANDRLTQYGVFLTGQNDHAFPNGNLARNLKQFFLEGSPPEGLSPVLFPVLEDFATLSYSPISFIQAPKLTTFRALNTPARDRFLNQICPFPLLRKFHLWSYKLDRNILDRYLSETPSIKEVYLVHNTIRHIPTDILQLEIEGVTIRAYICTKARYIPFFWNFASEADLEPITVAQLSSLSSPGT